MLATDPDSEVTLTQESDLGLGRFCRGHAGCCSSRNAPALALAQRRAAACCTALRIEAVGVRIRAAPPWRLDAARQGCSCSPARAR
jgi:hypothetical protein